MDFLIATDVAARVSMNYIFAFQEAFCVAYKALLGCSFTCKCLNTITCVCDVVEVENHINGILFFWLFYSKC